jgi:hypothetical protein
MRKSELMKILANMSISIPKEVENELLNQYGNHATDDEGHEFQYTEQDIYEQLRKKLRPYEKAVKPAISGL